MGDGQTEEGVPHVDDLADAVIFSLHNYSDEEHVNVGTGKDISIVDLARLIG